jgi:hypothetical protein
MNAILILTILFSVSANAGGDRVGNGGQFVSCDGKNKGVYFYDYYELTKLKQNDSIIKQFYPANPFSSAHDVIDRQSDENYLFKVALNTYISQMEQEIALTSNHLYLTHDYPDYMPLPSCQIDQAAISGQQEGGWFYVVYAPAWSSMSHEDQTALILHECIYRLGYANGLRTSLNVKKLNQALLLNDSKNDGGLIFSLRKELNFLLPGEKSSPLLDKTNLDY